jgi:tetratricopeptide (TPR) repeat protein
MKNLFLILFLCLASFVVAQSTADSVYAKAQLKAEAKDFTVASILIEKAIKMNPKEMKYYFFKADMEMALKNYKDAKKAYELAIKTFPDQSAPYCELGDYFRYINETDSSLKYINKAIKMAENDSLKDNYIMTRGVAYAYSKKYKKGEKDFQSVLKHNPNSTLAMGHLAFLYTMERNHAKAIPVLKKIILLDSSILVTYVNLGLIYTQMDSLQEALECYNKGTKIEPKDPYLLSNRGECYYRLKQYDKALIDINHSMTLLPTNSWVYKNRAKVYIAQSKFNYACIDLEKAESLGYSYNYDNEVKELQKKHCK